MTLGISVIIPTLRKHPQMQKMADSLVNTAKYLPKGVEYELIFVDGQLWYISEKERKQELEDAVAGRFAFTHIPPKPTIWQGPHRLTGKDCWDKNNASNTGLVYANYSCILFSDDCTVYDDLWMVEHYKFLTADTEKPIATCGPYKYVYAGTSKVENGRLVGGKFEEPGDHRLGFTQGFPIKAMGGGWMYGGNSAARLEQCLMINGFDEVMSGAGGLEDCEFGIRMERVADVWFVPGAPIYQIMETHETVAEFLSGSQKETGPAQEKKALPPCKGFKFRDDTGLVHHMTYNHLPIWRLTGHKLEYIDGYGKPVYLSRLEEDRKRTWTVGNNFSLKELRKVIRSGGQFPIPKGPTVDWRDRQLLSEMR